MEWTGSNPTDRILMHLAEIGAGRCTITDDTVVAVLAALGVDASTPHSVRSALAAYEDGAGRALLPRTVVARPGRPPDLAGLPEGTALRVETESGAAAQDLAAQDSGAFDPGALARLPLGVHVLHARTPDGRGARARLIVAPDRVPAPPAGITAVRSGGPSTPLSRSGMLPSLGSESGS